MRKLFWIYVFLAIAGELIIEILNLNSIAGIGVIGALLVLVLYYLVNIKRLLERNKNA